MCFILDRPNQRAKIAKKDIVCWKVIRNNNTSYFYNHKYIYYTLQLKVKLIFNEENDIISEGYHSYINTDMFDTGKIDIDFDSKKTKFLIPKGTRYYESKEYGEYISETIIMIKK